MRIPAALILFVFGSPVVAQDFEPVSIGHWNVIFRAPAGCFAINRPSAEADLRSHRRPINALMLFPVTKEEKGIGVYFWPGVDRSSIRVLSFNFLGDTAPIQLEDDLGAPTEYAFAGTLTSEAVNAFSNPPSHGLVVIETMSGNIGTVFDISDVPEVFEALDDCVAAQS